MAFKKGCHEAQIAFDRLDDIFNATLVNNQPNGNASIRSNQDSSVLAGLVTPPGFGVQSITSAQGGSELRGNPQRRTSESPTLEQRRSKTVSTSATIHPLPVRTLSGRACSRRGARKQIGRLYKPYFPERQTRNPAVAHHSEDWNRIIPQSPQNDDPIVPDTQESVAEPKVIKDPKAFTQASDICDDELISAADVLESSVVISNTRPSRGVQDKDEDSAADASQGIPSNQQTFVHELVLENQTLLQETLKLLRGGQKFHSASEKLSRAGSAHTTDIESLQTILAEQDKKLDTLLEHTQRLIIHLKKNDAERKRELRERRLMVTLLSNVNMMVLRMKK